MSDTQNSQELNLGITPKKSDDPCCKPCPVDGGSEEQYPEISFDGEHAALLMEKYGPFSTDDELTITFRTKIKKYSDGAERWDKCVKLCALAIIGDVVEEDASEETAEAPAKKAAPRKVKPVKEAGY